MPTKIITSALTGFHSTPVAVEADMSRNLPGIVIVGMGSKSVDEAKERIKSALTNSGLSLPKRRITINLAPADLPKDGSSYDLAMACAILSLSEQIPTDSLKRTAIYGELGLDGSLRPVRGIVSHVQSMKKAGVKTIIMPKSNSRQANLVKDITIIPCSNLKELYHHLTKAALLKPLKPSSHESIAEYKIDFSEVSGQEQAKRALEIAAAGHHNILMTGSPGAGKTMLARALPGILPPPTDLEITEMTQIHSLVNKDRGLVISTRPFRAPHHSASQVSLVGGGQNVNPGEVSLAHGGVLFLDEIPEFSRHTLESLRQPLEDGQITVSRANGSTIYPAQCIFIATKNPCPCGFAEDPKKECTCSANQLLNYKKKLSGPLLDRVDMIIKVDKIDSSKILYSPQRAEKSESIRKRVVQASSIQSKRQNKHNAYLSTKEVRSIIKLTRPAKEMLDKASSHLEMSARSYLKTLKVARTVADLATEEIVDSPHIAEALQYRLNTNTE